MNKFVIIGLFLTIGYLAGAKYPVIANRIGFS